MEKKSTMKRLTTLGMLLLAFVVLTACRSGNNSELSEDVVDSVPKYDNIIDSIMKNHGELGSFEEGLASVRINGKVGFVDTAGQLVIPPQFDGPTTWFRNGMARVALNGLYGWIDKTGKFVIQPEYDDTGIEEGIEGVFWVRKGEMVGLIDIQGNIITPIKWDVISEFNNGSAFAMDTFGKTYRIDIHGNEKRTNEPFPWKY
jgi:hypothetical protein